MTKKPIAKALAAFAAFCLLFTGCAYDFPEETAAQPAAAEEVPQEAGGAVRAFRRLDAAHRFCWYATDPVPTATLEEAAITGYAFTLEQSGPAYSSARARFIAAADAPWHGSLLFLLDDFTAGLEYSGAFPRDVIAATLLYCAGQATETGAPLGVEAAYESAGGLASGWQGSGFSSPMDVNGFRVFLCGGEYGQPMLCAATLADLAPDEAYRSAYLDADYAHIQAADPYSSGNMFRLRLEVLEAPAASGAGSAGFTAMDGEGNAYLLRYSPAALPLLPLPGEQYTFYCTKYPQEDPSTPTLTIDAAG